MVTKKLMRDFQRCLRSIQSFTDNQAAIVEWDEDHMQRVVIEIRPKEGPYQGGKFDFEIKLDNNYPKNAPQVNCLTRIYHPNIDPTCEEYNVCLSLFDDWQENFGLEDVIQGILFLLYNPNLEDPLSPYFSPDMDEDDFNGNVDTSLKGESVEEEEFTENCAGGEFSTEEMQVALSVILKKVETLKVVEEEEEKGEGDREANPANGADNNNAASDTCEACADEVQVVDTDGVAEGHGGEAAGMSEPQAVLGLVLRQESKLDKLDARAEPAVGTRANELENFSPAKYSKLMDYIPRVFVSGDRGLDTFTDLLTSLLSDTGNLTS